VLRFGRRFHFVVGEACRVAPQQLCRILRTWVVVAVVVRVGRAVGHWDRVGRRVTVVAGPLHLVTGGIAAWVL